MAVKMMFYPTKGGKRISQEVKPPTIVLAKKNGTKLGVIPNESVNFDCNLNSGNTIDFKVHKYYNGKKTRLWDKITNFKLIWCKEWDAWFEITIDITQSDETTKSVMGTSIGEAELSAIKLFGIEVNTEVDIAREDYEPTIIYDSENKSTSLLDRLIEKAPHYSIKHVDDTIASLQRTFTFDDSSILDGFNTIGEEIGCLFILSQRSNNKKPERGIYVYDLQSHCKDCGYRGEFTKQCPECGSSRIDNGYGKYTNVFISNENLAEELTVTTKTDEVNICFKLEAGDDLMTAAVASCNPNGSDYIWYIPNETRAEMSSGLKDKLLQYDTAYNSYMTDYQISIDSSLVDGYNALVNKYKVYKDDLEEITTSSGFESLIDISYNAIDFRLFLNTSLMPAPEMSETTAAEQASLLTNVSLASVGVANAKNISKATVESNVLSLAKAIVRPTYEVKINDSDYNKDTRTWTGTFTVTNYSDEEDTATTAEITSSVTDDYETYINQKIDKLINREDTDDLSVSGLFKKELIVTDGVYSGDFADELKKYGLSSLRSFHDSCQSCIDVLIEEGVSDSSIWLTTQKNLYDEFYTDYYNKLKALEAEMALRESEIATIDAVSDNINSIRTDIQNELNLKAYLGNDLWKEFCAFRRESTYSNSNYISDGLTNSELIKNANMFLKEARKELIKSATAQHTISSSLNNLLIMPEFEAIKSQFDVGNWIVVKIDDTLYRLRLVNYSINFDNPEDLSVEFSDVVNIGNDITDIKSVLDKASSMATSYQTIERQVGKNDETSMIVDSWFEKGLDATLTKIVNTADSQTVSFDKHGMWMRKYDEPTESYFDEQLRIINSTIAITNDDWETTKTAIGKFIYVHPETGEFIEAFGVNGETVIGKLIIGETLALYNNDNTLKFNEDGLSVTNGTNTFIVDPNADTLLKLLKGTTSVFMADANGNLNVTGAIVATSLSTGNKTSSSTGNSGLFIDSSGNLYSGSNNETIIYANGNVNLGNSKLVFDGTTLAVNGAITATTLSAGNKTSSATGDTGLFIDSSGNLYAGANNETIIYANGNVDLGNGKLTYNGSALSVNGAITATSLSTGGKTSSATGNSGTYIDSNGNLYSGANNETVIYANGNINLGNGKLVYNGSTLSVSGAITATTLSAGGKTSSSANHEGLFIASNGNLVAGANNETTIFANGNVNLGNGKLVYNGSTLSVNGAITATSLSSGGKMSSSSASGGTFISSSGAIYVGDSNQTTISSAGKITTKNLLVYGSETEITCTINDSITFKNDLIGTDNILGRFIEKSDTVSGTNIYNTFTIYGDHITFSRTNDGSCSIYYSGNKALQIDSSVQLDGSLNVDGSISSGGAIAIGGMNNGIASITAGSQNRAIIGVFKESNNEIVHVGAGSKSSTGMSGTYLHGEVVRIYSYPDGAVYLGASGNTAVVSDETLKDLFAIDDKYVDFFNRLNPLAYKYKVGHRTHLGFSAQSVEKALTDSGLTTEEFAGLLIDRDVDIGDDEELSPDGTKHFDKLYSLRYEEFITLNTLMIKQLQEEIRELKEQIGDK